MFLTISAVVPANSTWKSDCIKPLSDKVIRNTHPANCNCYLDDKLFNSLNHMSHQHFFFTFSSFCYVFVKFQRY